MTDLQAQSHLKAEEAPHSSRGASSANRWMNCTASPQLIEKIPEDEQVQAGFAADEGTAAHELAAKCLKDGQEPWEFIGTEIVVGSRSFVVDAEMSEAVQMHVDFVYSLMQTYEAYGPEIKVEAPLRSELHEKAYGTSDVIIEVPKAGLLIVVDYKHGIGVTAEPDKEQTRYYGYLALERSANRGSFEEVHLYIVQPRHPHPKGPVRQFKTTPDSLTDWFTLVVLPTIETTEGPDVVLKVGDWCRFCPARRRCPALVDATESMDASLEPVYFTDEELGDILRKADPIKKFLEACEQEAFDRAKKGRKIPGRKVVRKQASRIWKAEAEQAAKEKFGDKAYDPPTMKTPPSMEKLPGGKSFVTKYAYKPDSGLTLASEDDKRSEVDMSPEAIFGDNVEF